MYDGPWLAIEEFRASGLLHEVNRLILHPLGLALVVETGPGAVTMTEGEVEHLRSIADRPALDSETRSFLRDLAVRALTSEERLGGVWDNREDPEGIEYGANLLSEERARSVAETWDRRRPARVAALGYMVQPLSGSQLHAAVIRLLATERRLDEST